MIKFSIVSKLKVLHSTPTTEIKVIFSQPSTTLQKHEHNRIKMYACVNINIYLYSTQTFNI